MDGSGLIPLETPISKLGWGWGGFQVKLGKGALLDMRDPPPHNLLAWVLGGRPGQVCATRGNHFPPSSVHSMAKSCPSNPVLKLLTAVVMRLGWVEGKGVPYHMDMPWPPKTLTSKL